MLRPATFCIALAAATPALAQCIESNGQVACSDGRMGFVDSAGNAWVQDKNGQQNVLLNRDGNYRQGQQNDGPVIEERGLLNRLR